jgi:hypothetical protein
VRLIWTTPLCSYQLGFALCVRPVCFRLRRFVLFARDPFFAVVVESGSRFWLRRFVSTAEQCSGSRFWILPPLSGLLFPLRRWFLFRLGILVRSRSEPVGRFSVSTDGFAVTRTLSRTHRVLQLADFLPLG